MKVNVYNVRLSTLCYDYHDIKVTTPYQYDNDDLISILKRDRTASMYLSNYHRVRSELCHTETYLKWDIEKDYIITV